MLISICLSQLWNREWHSGAGGWLRQELRQPGPGNTGRPRWIPVHGTRWHSDRPDLHGWRERFRPSRGTPPNTTPNPWGNQEGAGIHRCPPWREWGWRWQCTSTRLQAAWATILITLRTLHTGIQSMSFYVVTAEESTGTKSLVVGFCSLYIKKKQSKW